MVTCSISGFHPPASGYCLVSQWMIVPAMSYVQQLQLFCIIVPQNRQPMIILINQADTRCRRGSGPCIQETGVCIVVAFLTPRFIERFLGIRLVCHIHIGKHPMHAVRFGASGKTDGIYTRMENSALEYTVLVHQLQYILIEEQTRITAELFFGSFRRSPRQ